MTPTTFTPEEKAKHRADFFALIFWMPFGIAFVVLLASFGVR